MVDSYREVEGRDGKQLCSFRADTERGTAPFSTFSIDVKPGGFSETLRAFNMGAYGLIKKDKSEKKKRPHKANCHSPEDGATEPAWRFLVRARPHIHRHKNPANWAR